ncbi:hypothetical protein SCUP234_12139 [Seiridium cupressi]
MQLKDILAWSFLVAAGPVFGRTTPISQRREAALSSHIQARDLPNLPSDDALNSYGLKKDSKERNFYDAFLEFEKDKAGDDKGLDNYWAFYSGKETHESINDFVKEFNDDKKHHEGLKDGDDKKITIPGEVYPDPESSDKIQDAQGKWMDEDDSDDSLTKVAAMPIAVMSWRGAQRAAKAGGIIRFLTLEKMADLEPGKYWTTFEAYELTKEGSNVEQILRYTNGKTDEKPKQIWKKGDKPLGSAVNWANWQPKEDTAKEEMGDDEFEKSKDEAKDAKD